MRKFLRLTNAHGKTSLPPILAMRLLRLQENHRSNWGQYTTRETAKGHSPGQSLDYISLKKEQERFAL